MPHGFGDVAKGAKEVMGLGLGQMGDFVSKEYNTGMKFITKFSDQYLDDMAVKRHKVANPHLYENVPFTGRKEGNWFQQKGNQAAHYTKDQFKGWGIGAGLSVGLYGLSAVMSDNTDADAGDRMVNYSKHAIAAGADLTVDAGLSAVAAGLATFGGIPGMAVGAGITAFNMFAGFAGWDAGSMVMNYMNYAEGKYDEAKAGPKFNMTQNTSMAMQRQIQNMHAAGSNLGEMMHN